MRVLQTTKNNDKLHEQKLWEETGRERERERVKKNLIIQDCLNDKKNVARIEANEE